jgi:hypothetical protein
MPTCSAHLTAAAGPRAQMRSQDSRPSTPWSTNGLVGSRAQNPRNAGPAQTTHRAQKQRAMAKDPTSGSSCAWQVSRGMMWPVRMFHSASARCNSHGFCGSILRPLASTRTGCAQTTAQTTRKKCQHRGLHRVGIANRWTQSCSQGGAGAVRARTWSISPTGSSRCRNCCRSFRASRHSSPLM